MKNKNSENTFALSETADAFLQKIKPLERRFIKNIQGKIENGTISKSFDFIQNHLPLFLDDEDYQQIENRLHKDSIATVFKQNFIELTSPTNLVTKEFIKKDPLGITMLGLKKLNHLNINSDDFMIENQYIVAKDGKHLLLFIEPQYSGSYTKSNAFLVHQLREIQQEIHNSKKNITLSYFGSPIITVDNAKQIKEDIQRTVFISSGILFILLIFYFRTIFVPFIIFIPTLIGVLLALTIMFFIKDYLSTISLEISAILIGITVDYALHILTHYKHKNSIEALYKDVSQPIVLSSTTTAISFLCLVFVHSEALKDLGIFAAITVMASAFFHWLSFRRFTPQKPHKTGNPASLTK